MTSATRQPRWGWTPWSWFAELRLRVSMMRRPRRHLTRDQLRAAAARIAKDPEVEVALQRLLAEKPQYRRAHPEDRTPPVSRND